MPDIELMVLPARVPEDPPRFLVASGGVWRDLGSAAKLEDLSKLQARIDDQLRFDMETLDTAGGGPLAIGNYISSIYEPLVPEALNTLLRAAQPDHAGDPPPLLRIHSDPTLDWIPWEVAHDGDDFLSRRFRIARLPIVPLAAAPDVKDPWPVQRIYTFLGEFVLDATQLATWNQTFPPLGNGTAEERFPNLPATGFPRVGDVERAVADASIVHFTCHGGLRDGGTEGGSFWTLNHKQPASPQFKIHAPIVRALKARLPKSRPLVFGNACGSSGQAAGIAGLVNSFGALFIQSGASAFVGTVAPISKVRAIEFATRFYQKLLVEGEPIATALWRTKNELSNEAPGDPSPLFYAQYGPPNSRYGVS